MWQCTDSQCSTYICICVHIKYTHSWPERHLILPVSSSETPKCYSIKTFCLLNQHVWLCVCLQDQLTKWLLRTGFLKRLPQKSWLRLVSCSSGFSYHVPPTTEYRLPTTSWQLPALATSFSLSCSCSCSFGFWPGLAWHFKVCAWLTTPLKGV